MARFLTTTDCSAAIERVIREAEGKLTLISAYVWPRIVYYERLRDAGERGVETTIIFGKRAMPGKVFKEFANLPRTRLYYLDVLHAKCYFNEREAVITSLNLLGWSEQANREMGVLLSATEDAAAYQAMVKEVASILRVAELRYTTWPGEYVKRGKRSVWEKRLAQLPTVGSLGKAPSERVIKKRKEHPRAYQRWTREEDALLRDMHAKGLTPYAISDLLQRQPSAIISRLEGLDG